MYNVCFATKNKAHYGIKISLSVVEKLRWMKLPEAAKKDRKQHQRNVDIHGIPTETLDKNSNQ